jgi:hypothetical protein
MTDTQTNLDPAVLRFSAALLRAMDKRRDLGGYIWPAYRELVAEHPDVDAWAEEAAVQAALASGGDNPSTIEEVLARGSLAGAAMHCWYRIPEELRGIVRQAAKELAVIAGEDPLQAHIEIDRVIAGARTAGEALTVAYEANVAKAAERRAKRSQDEIKRMRKRLNVV